MWENYFPERHGMSLPEQYAAGERFGGSKVGSDISVSNSKWYDYLVEVYREIAIHWCRDNELEYEDEEDRSPGTNLL